jgi:hypothetical protein
VKLVTLQDLEMDSTDSSGDRTRVAGPVLSAWLPPAVVGGRR